MPHRVNRNRISLISVRCLDILRSVAIIHLRILRGGSAEKAGKMNVWREKLHFGWFWLCPRSESSFDGNEGSQRQRLERNILSSRASRTGTACIAQQDSLSDAAEISVRSALIPCGVRPCPHSDRPCFGPEAVVWPRLHEAGRLSICVHSLDTRNKDG